MLKNESFRKETIWTQPITIKIFKQIPVAAGLGGGSADAACVLKMLNLLAPKARVSEEKMVEIGLNLGSDVPACLSGKTLKMEGRGEKLSIIGVFKKLYLEARRLEVEVRNTALSSQYIQ